MAASCERVRKCLSYTALLSPKRVMTVSNIGKQPKNEKLAMKNFYELTYILSPVLEDEKYAGLVEYVNKLVTDNGGEIVEVDEWGNRKLAYEIDKKGTGYYVNMYFNIDGNAIEAIERNMRFHDDIMRYITLKYDAKMLRYYDLRKKGEAPTLIEEEEVTEEDN